MTWIGFAAVFGLFFLTHSLPLRPAIKAQIIGVTGAHTFRIGYSVLSLATLSLLIWAAGQAPYVQLWPQTIWQRHVVQAGMLAVCLIFAFSIARPNPFSFGGANNSAFNPHRPGLVRITRHPILLALALWAGLHLLPNGDLAHVILFGVLGGFAIAGRNLINRRKRREIGPAKWHALDATVAQAPVLKSQMSLTQVILRLGVGVTLFAGLLWVHPVLLGVSAL
jgi:uncharacterized membrane protein